MKQQNTGKGIQPLNGLETNLKRWNKFLMLFLLSGIVMGMFSTGAVIAITLILYLILSFTTVIFLVFVMFIELFVKNPLALARPSYCVHILFQQFLIVIVLIIFLGKTLID